MNRKRELKNSLILNKGSLFSLGRFPVLITGTFTRNVRVLRRISTKSGSAEGRVAQISLYFSLLAGNLRRRLVRSALRRQPASAVSSGHFRI
jgi:hypothetical protein